MRSLQNTPTESYSGSKVYLEFTYRRPRFLASTLVAVQAVLLGFTASNCIVFGEYVLFAFQQEPDSLYRKWLAVVLLSIITIIHGCFLRAGIFIQNVLGWVKLGLICFMVLTSLVVLFRHPQSIESTVAVREVDSSLQYSSWDTLWEGSVWNWGILSTALFKVFYSYAGLENVNNVLNEVKDPVRTLRSATSAALITACVLYLLVNIAYFSIVPVEEIKHSGELVAALFFERTFGATLGRIFLPLAVATSAAGNVMVVTFALARLNQEIARSGFLPLSSLLASSKPFNAPMGGLMVHYIPSLLVITIPTGNIYSFILDVEGYPAQFFAMATSVGLIWLRFKRPDLHRPYKAWLSGVILRMLLSLALIVAPFVPRDAVDGVGHLRQVSYALVGIAIILFGVAYWYIWTVFLPRWKGYELDEAVEVLDDGTTVTRLVHIPKSNG